MATSLECRVLVLENADGGGECPRCSGISVTFVNSEFDNASRYGEPMSKDKYQGFESEEGPGGECPKCGERPITIEAP